MIKLSCPHCGEHHSIPVEQSGQITVCAQCRKKFRVPVRRNAATQKNKSSAPKVASTESDRETASNDSELDFAGLAEMERESEAIDVFPQNPSSRDESRSTGGYALGKASVSKKRGSSSGTKTPAEEVIELWEVLREIRMPDWEIEAEDKVAVQSSPSWSWGGALLGTGIAVLFDGIPLWGFIAGGRNLGQSNGSSESSSAADSVVGRRSIFKERAKRELKERGFPIKPAERLDKLISAIKYRSLDSLVPMLESVKNRESRIGAIVASGYLDDAAVPVMPLLLKALRDDDEKVRERSIAAIGLIGPAGAEAVPNISRMLLNDEQWLSSASQVLDSLSRMEPLSVQVWPEFVQALLGKEAERRDQALAIFLASPQSLAHSAGASLLRALKTATPEQRNLLLDALVHANPKLAKQQMSSAERWQRSLGKIVGGLVLVVVSCVAVAVSARGCAGPHSLPAPDTKFKTTSQSGATSSESVANVKSDGEINEQELKEFFPWVPPDGWQRDGANQRTGMLGGKFLTFHARKPALPSIDVKFDFKRENISEADMLVRLKRTTTATNTVGGSTKWLPTKSIGRRTVHVIEILNNSARSMRNYRWMVSERNVECTVAISGSPAEFATAMAAFEPSLEAAIAGHDPNANTEIPNAKSPTTESDDEPKKSENGTVPTSDLPSNGADPRDSDVSPMNSPTKANSAKSESAP